MIASGESKYHKPILYNKFCAISNGMLIIVKYTIVLVINVCNAMPSYHITFTS